MDSTPALALWLGVRLMGNATSAEVITSGIESVASLVLLTARLWCRYQNIGSRTLPIPVSYLFRLGKHGKLTRYSTMSNPASHQPLLYIVNRYEYENSFQVQNKGLH